MRFVLICFFKIPFFIVFMISSLVSLTLYAEVIRIAPEEYETSGAMTVGRGGGGAANASGVSAVRQNPALLSVKKEYTLEGGFHWPIGGREFFQAGVVDSKTSTVAAGFLYTGFVDEYKIASERSLWFDSPVKRRFALALSYPIARVALGVSSQYVEGHALNFNDDGQLQTIKGWTVGAGAATSISDQLKIGASLENAANKKVQEFAPTVLRIGGLYTWTEALGLGLDYKRRQRVARFEGRPLSFDTISVDQIPELVAEQMVVGTLNFQAHEHLLFVAGYGQALHDKEFKTREVLSAGISIMGKGAALIYTLAQPQRQRSASLHHALQLNIGVAM